MALNWLLKFLERKILTNIDVLFALVLDGPLKFVHFGRAVLLVLLLD
jgi:hypothetical protein